MPRQAVAGNHGVGVLAKPLVAVSWSGGKDSALALLAVRADLGRRLCALITTVTETYSRISMHGVPRELLALQAQEIGLPLVEVMIPPACPNELYEARMQAAFASQALRDIGEVVFGDLFPRGRTRLSRKPSGRRWQAGSFPPLGSRHLSTRSWVHPGRLSGNDRLRRSCPARPLLRRAEL
jgi:hypothetical protein